MKQIFTLFLAFVCSLMSKSYAQVSQGFETQDEVNLLAASCWTFNNFGFTDVNPTFGSGSVQSQLNATSNLITPQLDIPSSLTISFNYKKVAENNGAQKIQVILLNGTTETMLHDFNPSSSATYSRTFVYNANNNSNIGGIKRVIIRTNNNVSIQIDELSINAPYHYAGGCPPENLILPVTLVSFSGNIAGEQASLKWKVADNEEARLFDVEKSFDGKNFTSAGIVLSTSKVGDDEYAFAEKVAASRVSYRLKMVDKDGKINYSRILSLSVQNVQGAAKNLSLMNNPVTSNMVLSYHSYKTSPVSIQIFNEAGALLYKRQQLSNTGVNQFSIDATQLKKGTYFIQVVNEMMERSMVKAVKL